MQSIILKLQSNFGGGGYDGQAYHLFSSPFSDATISQFGDDMGLVLNTAYNTASEPAFVRPFPTFFQFEDGMSDETTIYFQKGATSNYDNGFDAGKLHKMNSKFSTIYSYATDMEKEKEEYFSINGLANFDQQLEIPLAMNILKEGNHEITLRTMKYFHSKHEIYLYDSLTDSLHNLRINGDYKFEAKIGTEVKRFVLVFKADANKDFFTNEKVVVYPNPTTNQFAYSLKTAREGNYKITLFDATGKLVFEESKTKEGAFLEGTINFETRPKGLYLLQISDSKKVNIVRIIKE